MYAGKIVELGTTEDIFYDARHPYTWGPVSYTHLPDTVFEALKELGKTKEEAIYVGDSDVDIETAKNAGMPCISVLWGFRDKEFLAEHGAEYYAETTEEVSELIAKIEE